MTGGAYRIGSIHRKRKRTVGIARPRRDAEDEEEDDTDEEGDTAALGAAATFVRLLPDDEDAAEPEASWL